MNVEKISRDINNNYENYKKEIREDILTEEKEKIIPIIGKELTKLSVKSDWWLYVYPTIYNKPESDLFNVNQSIFYTMRIAEVIEICTLLNISESVISYSLNIYDYRTTEKDIDLIKKLHTEYCE